MTTSSGFQNFELLNALCYGQSFLKCSLGLSHVEWFVKTLFSGPLHQDSNNLHIWQSAFSTAAADLKITENPGREVRWEESGPRKYFRNSIRKESNFLRLRRAWRSRGPGGLLRCPGEIFLLPKRSSAPDFKGNVGFTNAHNEEGWTSDYFSSFECSFAVQDPQDFPMTLVSGPNNPDTEFPNSSDPSRQRLNFNK